MRQKQAKKIRREIRRQLGQLDGTIGLSPKPRWLPNVIYNWLIKKMVYVRKID